MGLDGGTKVDDRKVIVTQKKEPKKSPEELRLHFGWTLCHLSQEPLQPPIVTDQFGQLYNKESLLEALLSKSLDKSKYGHIHGLRDLTDVNFFFAHPEEEEEQKKKKIIGVEEGESLFICPISKKEMCGSLKFLCLKPCGHVVYEKVLTELEDDHESNGHDTTTTTTTTTKNGKEYQNRKKEGSCPVCGKKFLKEKDLIHLNPPLTILEDLKKKYLEEPTTKKKSSSSSTSSRKRKESTFELTENSKALVEPRNVEKTIISSSTIIPSDNCHKYTATAISSTEKTTSSTTITDVMDELVSSKKVKMDEKMWNSIFLSEESIKKRQNPTQSNDFCLRGQGPTLR